MFTKRNQVSLFKLSDGITSRILGSNNSLMIVEDEFTQGATAQTHHHINEQAGY